MYRYCDGLVNSFHTDFILKCVVLSTMNKGEGGILGVYVLQISQWICKKKTKKTKTRRNIKADCSVGRLVMISLYRSC